MKNKMHTTLTHSSRDTTSATSTQQHTTVSNHPHVASIHLVMSSPESNADADQVRVKSDDEIDMNEDGEGDDTNRTEGNDLDDSSEEEDDDDEEEIARVSTGQARRWIGRRWMRSVDAKAWLCTHCLFPEA